MHEVPWTVEKFISSDGAALATVARFVTEATIRLANHVVRRVIICDYPSQCNITQVIPFSAADYAQTLSQWLTLLHAKLDHLEVPKYLSNYELRFRALITASSKFREAAEALDERVKVIFDFFPFQLMQ